MVKREPFLKQKSAAPLIVSNTRGGFYGRFVYGSKMKLVSIGNMIDSPAMYTIFRKPHPKPAFRMQAMQEASIKEMLLYAFHF